MVVVEADFNSVSLPPSCVQLPSKLKTRLYKIMVKFMSSTFLSRTNQSVRAQSPVGGKQPDPNSEVLGAVASPSVRRSENFATQSGASNKAKLVQHEASSVVTMPVRVSSSQDDTSEYPSLMDLRKGFMKCMAQLLFRYRLFWDRALSPDTFQSTEFVNHCREADRPFLTSLTASRAFWSFLEVRRAASLSEILACEFEGLVLDCLAEQWAQLDIVNGLSVVGYLHVARGADKLKKRWVVLRGNTISVYKSKRRQKKVKDLCELVPGEFHVSSLSPSSGPRLSISPAPKPPSPAYQQKFFLIVHMYNEPEFRIRADSHEVRKQWLHALQARSLTDEVKAKWLASLHERKHYQQRVLAENQLRSGVKSTTTGALGADQAVTDATEAMKKAEAAARSARLAKM